MTKNVDKTDVYTTKKAIVPSDLLMYRDALKWRLVVPEDMTLGIHRRP